ncbi:GL19450 [Drosophila persimilis]|uniref:GL19450 n=1 Tax=Drosophila persimilis TaxID=7234 RepID=B4G9B5_DROPE|nr:uncharacterized protein LOC6588758 [Drosophila persimilis]XP_026844453.1 uncharacterized protein LOC6588758 [Drosophila persimilis]EDW28945.1 GL19450 [Drosophila persimilis]
MKDQNFVSYLVEFCVKLKLNTPKYRFVTEANREFSCNVELQDIQGYGRARSKQSAAHVAARNVWTHIILLPVVRVLLQEKDFKPYIREGDIFWEIRLLKTKQFRNLRELLVLVDKSIGNIWQGSVELSSLSVQATTEVRMGDRVWQNVPIVEVTETLFFETLTLPVVLVSSRSKEVIVSSVLDSTEDPETSSLEICPIPMVPEVPVSKAQGSASVGPACPALAMDPTVPQDVHADLHADAEAIETIKLEEVAIPVSPVFETRATVVQKSPPVEDIVKTEEDMEKLRIFQTYRNITKKNDPETKPVRRCDYDDYFMNLPKDLKKEGFKVINSNDFKTAKEKAISLLNALKLPHTFSQVKSISGRTMIKLELDCNYNGIWIDFETDIYSHFIEYMVDMLD